MKRAMLCLLAACAARSPSPTTPAPKPAARERIDGFIPLEWDAASGRVYLAIERLDEDFILQIALSGGLGSTPVGLDRGALGGSSVVRFERHGSKVLLVQRPIRYRAVDGEAAARRAVEDSFASSVLWGFTVEEGAAGLIVDATDFFLSDALGAAREIEAHKEGDFTVDGKRSAVDRARSGAFPRNTEVDAIVTLAAGKEIGDEVRRVTPDPRSVTLRQHFSFVAAPPPGYTPRAPDPRVGVMAVEVQDYSSPFTAALVRRFILRHRLDKPIVYYVDPAIPSPIREAVIEGASWWREAFAAAGHPDGFRVELLPPGVDIMDARYNVILWVHRATRGWSLGDAIGDPRTGEILAGRVLLGSQRIRQDVLIARGLVPQYDERHDRALAELDPATSPSVMALARIRQLAAHEVGHTLGLEHNMAASAAGRASVMDYPAPLVKIVGGKLDLSEAYATGIGAYDKLAIRYAYETDPARAAEAARAAPLFVNDPQSRPPSAAHPLGSVWDNGNDPVAMLRHEIEVRRIALEAFGLRNVAVGQPLSSLEELLVPLYLHHRYQLAAAGKSIGGVTYGYAVKEDGAVVPGELRQVVPPARQREALAAVLATLDVKFLRLPDRVVDLIPPRADGTEGGVAELFERHTTPLFDPVAAATVAADLTLEVLLDESRAARLVQLSAEDPANLSFAEVTDALVEVAMAPTRGRDAPLTRATRSLLAQRLMRLAAAAADPEVRAGATDALRALSARCARPAAARDRAEAAHRHATRDDIERFLARPDAPRSPPAPPATPPGPPI